jgi:hypothetical protein
MIFLVQNSTIANNEDLAKTINYRSLVKEKMKNMYDDDKRIEQIYSCAFQVVLHPENFEPVIIWLNPEFTKIDDVFTFLLILHNSEEILF